jgi:SAM-dependent methyltransferase
MRNTQATRTVEGMQPHHHTGETHQHLFENPGAAEYAELEGDVFADLTNAAIARAAEHCRLAAVRVRRVIDIGCGPGVGTSALARQFEDAQIVAVDGSHAMLDRAAARVARTEAGTRVETRFVDLPDDLDTLGKADLVWASMVLHHLGDEVEALRRVRALLEPDGVLALVERAGPLRVLPALGADHDRGLAQRIDAAWEEWFARMRAHLPGATNSDAYPAMIERAGFELMDDRVLPLVLDAPLTDDARRFALHHLLRTRAQLSEHLAPADLDALDALAAESEGGARLTVHATRHVYIARPARVRAAVVVGQGMPGSPVE